MNAKMFAASLVVFCMLSSASAWAGRLHPALEGKLRSLRPGEMLAVIVEMKDQLEPEAAAARGAGRGRISRARALIQSLKEHSDRTQNRVRDQLERDVSSGSARSFIRYWIFNGFAVTATEPVIRRLAAQPDVDEVRLDRPVPLPAPVPAAMGASSSDGEWNIAKIRAPESWALGQGFDGTGAVVASFDTGVDFTHPDLAPRYRGNHAISWFDPYGEHDEPYDFHGHGTHTTGTAVGGNASGTFIGVAPGAKWIAAKGWNDWGISTASVFHRIFEWFLAPGEDPANAPDVVINSWAFEESGCDSEFLADIRAWRAAGIFPAFASGNDGPEPGSVRSPGAYAESFTVGATDYFDQIAEFSGQGPSPCDQAVKPNISAPGDGILSAVPGGYTELSGTSMATPHVAGAAAVLRSVKPEATVDEMESALKDGALDLGPEGPDNAFGAGRLDLFVSAQVMLLGPDAPRVKVVATSPRALEAGSIPGVFTLTRTGSTEQSLAVGYTIEGTAVAGSDYTALSGSATFSAGSDTTTVTVVPSDDPVVEFDETVILSLTTDPSYIVASPGSASVTIVSDEIPPDLSLTAFSSPGSAAAGDAITVTDTVKNVGHGPADPSMTRFFLSTNGTVDAGDVTLGERLVPSLAPGASDSGSTTLTIPASTVTGSYYLIAKADGDNALLETSEGNNTYVRSILIGPDLFISALSVPASAGAGMAMSISDTVKNQGGAAAAPSTIRFFISPNSLFDPSDVLLGSRSIPALAPGASSSGTTSVTIPAGTATGTHYIFARADADESVPETSETNNSSSRGVVVGPDLNIAGFSAPSSGETGGTITVTDTVRNTGGGSASPTVIAFYLSANALLDASDSWLGTRAVPALAPGASDSGSTTLAIPQGVPTGSLYLIAKADGENGLTETNEGNNTYARTIQIGPDLVVSAMTVPATSGAGMVISIADTVKNQGGAPAPQSTINFFLSTNSSLEPSDALLGSRTVPSIPAGATNSGNTTVTVPVNTPTGVVVVFALADAGGTVLETQENNNATSRSVSIGPDLGVSAFSAPASAQAGMPLTATDTVRNSGGGEAAATVTAFYLSTNSTLDAGDSLLGTRSVAVLAPAATSSGSTSLVIPASTATGSYYLIAKADGENALAETSETNNTSARSIQIGPDLIVSSLSAPAASGAGMTIALLNTVKNQGGAAATPSVIKFFLSPNASFDPSDVLLGSRSIPALPPGATNSGSTPVTIPGDAPTGALYIFARADADDAVVETQENNNSTSRSIAVGPDLNVPAFSAPAAAPTGSAISVTDTVKNAGGGVAAATVTRFFLSANGLLDNSDIPLGARPVAALAPGATSSGTVSVQIPAGTAAGSYYIIAKADGDNALPETNEGNNTYGRSIQITVSP